MASLSWLLVVVATALIFAGAFLWQGIYELRVTGEGAFVWRVNRFTGTVVMCQPLLAYRESNLYAPICTSPRLLTFAEAIDLGQSLAQSPTATPTPIGPPRSRP